MKLNCYQNQGSYSIRICAFNLLNPRNAWMFLVILTTFILNNFSIQAQTLNEKEFIAIVLKYHPIARKSFLGIESAKADVTISRGEFDPVLESGNQQKELNNATYYQYSEGRIRIPTWYGVEVNAGFERAQGDYINPERTEGTLGYVGVQFPLLQNLIIDKRRAALQKAQLMVNLSQYEQQLILNDLILEAVTRYWMWVQEVQNLELIRMTRENVKQRLDWVNTSILIGERAPIDSVEAITQLNYLDALQTEAEFEMQNALTELSVYTWNENGNIQLLPSTLQPEKLDSIGQQTDRTMGTLTELEQLALQNHPALSSIPIKLSYLEIERKLAFQKLLPKLDLKYNVLMKSQLTSNPLLTENYNLGVKFSMPLRLSEGRGMFRQANLAIQQTKLDQDLKTQQVLSKVRMEYNQFKGLVNILETQKQLLRNQESLLEGENTRFRNGESSLFLINSREQKLLETKQKNISIQAKLQIQRNKLWWSTGTLAQ